jgi:anti-sigma-K factor RskA
MTQRPALPPDDDADALAAEYVLGVLDLPDRQAAEARAKADPAFAARITAWEARLAPLADDIAPLPAPDLLPQIEARLFPKPARARRGFSWRFLAGGLTAAALALALLLAQEPPAEGPQLTASLTAETQALQIAARYDVETGTLTLTREGGAPAAAGQDYQLWAIGADGVPASLGLLRDAAVTVEAQGLAPGIVLAVSLEPAGGSPLAVPTGPVLVTGALAEATSG